MQRIKFFLQENTSTAVVAAILIFLTVVSVFASGVVMTVLLFLATVGYLAYLYYCFSNNYMHAPQEAGVSMSDLNMAVLTRIDIPVIMITEDNTIMWHNKAFSDYKDWLGEAKYGQNVKNICGNSFSYAEMKGDKKNTEITLGDKTFSVNAVYVSSTKRNYCIAFFYDISEITTLRKYIKDKNLVIGYACVDNADEVSSYLQASYRTTVAKAYAELYAWVSDMGGILKEYDRDKYIIIVEHDKLRPNIASEFDILGRINNAVSGDSNRLTLSMSFACIDGTLPEKDAESKLCMDHALQRGGAQVAVKTGEDIVCYGGGSKAMERTTRIKSRVTAEKLKELVSNCSNVLIMGHKLIDVDAIAAACGMARFVMELGKPVNIVVNPDDPWLSTATALLSDMPEYEEMFVDCVRGQELLQTDTAVIIVDVSNQKIFESPDIYKNANKIAIIDHHAKEDVLENTPTVVYIDPTASSASELVCEILEQAMPRSVLKKGEAELLYAGIILDTQHLTRNLGVRTFGAAMYLRLDPMMLSRAQALFKPNIGEYTKQAVYRRNTEIYRDVVAISRYYDDALPENVVMNSIAADAMLGISGVCTSFAVANVKDKVHVSCRSNGVINARLAAYALGGGGRFEAGAAYVEDATVDEVVERLKPIIDKLLDDKNSTGGNKQ